MHPTTTRRAIAWSTAGLLTGFGVLLGGPGLQVFALAGLLVVVLRGFDLGRDTLVPRAPGWLLEAVGPLVIVGMCVLLYGRLLLGDMPVNHDHPVMLLRAWVTGTELIPAGRLSGYSLFQFAGHPANALYPMGTDLLVCGIKGLGLGLISWETAYCWALFIAVVAYPTALYALGRRAGGPLAGLVAGLIGLLDRGAWFHAGWDFNLNWGVWSMGLSFSLCLWSLWAFERLARTPGRRRLWLGASLALAGALLCHPMAVALLGLGLPLMLLGMALAGRLGAPGKWMPRVVSAALTGVALSAFWLVPFIARQAWFEPLASPYRPFTDVIRGLLDGQLLAAFAPGLAVAGAVGLVLAARRRRPLALFLLCAAGLLLFLSSDTFLMTFDVLKKLPALGQLQLERFSYLIRAALILGFGMLIVELVARQPDSPPPSGSAPARIAMRLVLALVLAPILLWSHSSGPYPWIAPADPLEWSSDSSLYKDLRAAAEGIGQIEDDSVGRIALIGNQHTHMLMGLPVYTGRPIFKVGFTPENNYRYKFSSQNPEVFRALGVTHALSIGPRSLPGFEELGRFGRLVLYRFTPPPLPPVRLTGPGRAEIESVSREGLTVRLSGTGPTSRVIVHRARYALWRATIDDRPVEIDGARIADSPEIFMSIPAADGVLRLRWADGAAEWIGNLLSLLAVLLLTAVALAGRLGRLRWWPTERLRAWAGPAGDALTLASLAGGLVIGLALLLKILLPGSPSLPGRDVLFDLADALPEAKAEVIRPGRTEPCSAWDGSRHACPGPNWNYAGEVIVSADHQLRQCIWLHPIQGARLSVTFPDVELGEFIQGHFALDDRVVEPPRPHDVDLIVLLDGQQVGRFTCPARRGWPTWEVATPGRTGDRGDITIQSEAKFTGRRHFCFTAYTTRPDP